jgi:hypothetical protein
MRNPDETLSYIKHGHMYVTTSEHSLCVRYSNLSYSEVNINYMKEVSYIYIEQDRSSSTSPVKSELCRSSTMSSGLGSLHANYTKNIIITNSEY